MSSAIAADADTGRSALQNWRAGTLATLLGASTDNDAHVKAQPISDGLRLEGHWWYRGESTVESFGTRTLLVYRVFDAADDATGGDWRLPRADYAQTLLSAVDAPAGVLDSTPHLVHSIEAERDHLD